MFKSNSLREELYALAKRRPPLPRLRGWTSFQLFQRKKRPASYHHVRVELSNMVARNMLRSRLLTAAELRRLPQRYKIAVYTAGPVRPTSPRYFTPHRRVQKIKGFRQMAREAAARRKAR